MRLSISAKIFVGFLLVLATFGGVAIYGTHTMHHLGDELRLVSRGYLDLRLQLGEINMAQTNLLKELELLGKEGPARARLVKPDLDTARRVRLLKLPKALETLTALEALNSSAEEHVLLAQLRRRLKHVDLEFRADEERFDEAFGPIGDRSLLVEDWQLLAPARERLWQKEEAIRKQLGQLNNELKLRAEQASLRLDREEDRAVWATLLSVVIAMAVGVGVMVMATLTVRPLRRLAAGAKEIARGDYKQRVEAGTPDEIGMLGREFNAMAAALEEREQRLIRSERLAAVGKIAAQITHEVRNPLSSIGLNAEMLEEETSGETKELARAIVKEVDRLTEITEQYLRLARLPRPKLEREELGSLVASLVGFMRPELEARGIVVEVVLATALPPVLADEAQLRQALLNLLRNAAEAMPAGGRLRVATRGLDAESVELCIADDGEGIAPANLSKVFDPFFSTKEGGTGLGLALTQQIIGEHGGKIDVESEPGRGTTFLVRLPAAASPSSSVPAVSAARAPVASGRRVGIL